MWPSETALVRSEAICPRIGRVGTGGSIPPIWPQNAPAASTTCCAANFSPPATTPEQALRFAANGRLHFPRFINRQRLGSKPQAAMHSDERAEFTLGVARK